MHELYPCRDDNDMMIVT